MSSSIFESKFVIRPIGTPLFIKPPVPEEYTNESFVILSK